MAENQDLDFTVEGEDDRVLVGDKNNFTSSSSPETSTATQQEVVAIIEDDRAPKSAILPPSIMTSSISGRDNNPSIRLDGDTIEVTDSVYVHPNLPRASPSPEPVRRNLIVKLWVTYVMGAIGFCCQDDTCHIKKVTTFVVIAFVSLILIKLGIYHDEKNLLYGSLGVFIGFMLFSICACFSLFKCPVEDSNDEHQALISPSKIPKYVQPSSFPIHPNENQDLDSQQR